MKIRLATIQDKERIEELFERNGVGKPTLANCFVAEDNGEIIGAVNSVPVSVLEMACESPVASRRLYDTMMGYSTGSHVICYTKNEQVREMLTQMNWIEFHNNVSVLVKE